jgi:hypothetical protein
MKRCQAHGKSLGRRTVVDRQLFQRVCDVLDQAGFRMRDGARGLVVVSTSQGVRVGWSPSYAPRVAAYLGTVSSDGARGGYGRGIKAAMSVAVAAVLEQAGFRVQGRDADLLVTFASD